MIKIIWKWCPWTWVLCVQICIEYCYCWIEFRMNIIKIRIFEKPINREKKKIIKIRIAIFESLKNGIWSKSTYTYDQVTSLICRFCLIASGQHILKFWHYKQNLSIYTDHATCATLRRTQQFILKGMFFKIESDLKRKRYWIFFLNLFFE